MSTGFISETSATPLMGGGVTLNIVIGDDIAKFDWFLKTVHFPSQEIPDYGSRASFYFPYWNFSKKLRRIIGCRLSHFLESNHISRLAHCRMVAAKMTRHLVNKMNGSKLLICPNSMSALAVTHQLKKAFSFEYVTWIMDDHLVHWKSGQWCYPTNGSERLLRENLIGAKFVYVISPAMQEFYRDRFGVDSIVLCSPAETLGRKAIVKSGRLDVLRLVYFGSLGRWQNDAVSLLAPFIESGDVSLDVYSQNPEAIPIELVNAGARRKERIKPEEVLNKTREYDAVVLPISFEDELRNMSCFNIATKFSECLAATIPTLLIGPEYSIMVKMAKDAGACAIASKPEVGSVKAALEALKDPDQRQTILDAEWRLHSDEFSEEVMRRRWEPASAFLFS